MGLGTLMYTYLKEGKKWNKRGGQLLVLGSVISIINAIDFQNMTWGIIPLIVGIAAIVGLLVILGDNSLVCFMACFITFNLIGAVICGIILWSSYGSYMSVTNFKTTQYQQYVDTVNKYEALISKDRGNGAELTDLKFQGFQQSLAKMIEALRLKVVDFNETVADKRILANNPLIGFLIFPPGPEVELLPLMNQQ
jgi:hypothetical protein